MTHRKGQKGLIRKFFASKLEKERAKESRIQARLDEIKAERDRKLLHAELREQEKQRRLMIKRQRLLRRENRAIRRRRFFSKAKSRFGFLKRRENKNKPMIDESGST